MGETTRPMRDRMEKAQSNSRVELPVFQCLNSMVYGKDGVMGFITLGIILWFMNPIQFINQLPYFRMEFINQLVTGGHHPVWNMLTKPQIRFPGCTEWVDRCPPWFLVVEEKIRFHGYPVFLFWVISPFLIVYNRGWNLAGSMGIVNQPTVRIFAIIMEWDSGSFQFSHEILVD